MKESEGDPVGEAKRKADAKAAEKAKEFLENPDNFVNIHDCLLVIIRQDGEGNRYAVMNNCKSIQDVFMADGFARESLQNRRDQIRVLQAQKNHSGIQIVKDMPPLPGSNGGISLVKG